MCIVPQLRTRKPQDPALATAYTLSGSTGKSIGSDGIGVTPATARRDLQLVVSRVLDRCTVLGPGTRFVIWVQGCPLTCPGCLAEELLPFDGGHKMDISELAERTVADPDVTGVTFSGGEPFAQPAAVAAVIRAAREQRPELSAMSYSGYTLRWLQNRGSPPQRDLLSVLDILIDGPYVERQHQPLRWRASSNQVVNVLTQRHQGIEHEPDESAGIEFSLMPDSTLSWAGVPPVPRFRARLRKSFEASGLTVEEFDP